MEIKVEKEELQQVSNTLMDALLIGVIGRDMTYIDRQVTIAMAMLDLIIDKAEEHKDDFIL